MTPLQKEDLEKIQRIEEELTWTPLNRRRTDFDKWANRALLVVSILFIICTAMSIFYWLYKGGFR